MSIVVWDGTTLATDRAATDGTTKWRATKAWRHTTDAGTPLILSGVGPLQTILAMKNWMVEGADQNRFPSAQLAPLFCHFLVVSPTGLIRYEQSPLPIDHHRCKCAFGEGAPFAYGAMAMGASAAKAVEIANQHSVYCGLGVDTYNLPI
jgi:hypothetical protein|tara:strand:- start:192 stop:638 length:447 start_codon:yes stop_codon:yes gene_type:complete